METKRETMPRKVAVFDIDGTIFRSSLLIEVVEVLIEEGVFSVDVRAEYEREKKEWLDRKGDYEAYIMAVVGTFLQNIKGVHYDDYMRAARIVVERYRFRTYRFTEELIRALKAEGYFLLAISQSPKNILDLFCKEVGFDKVYGRYYDTDAEGRFLGTVKDEDLISDKAAILKRAIEKEGLILEDSVGVGDTEGDISFLNMVARPICFNPNMKLYEHAKSVGWEIIVERKDVIYELNEGN